MGQYLGDSLTEIGSPVEFIIVGKIIMTSGEIELKFYRDYLQ